MKTMKKVTATILCMFILAGCFSVSLSASAALCPVPVVYIEGQGSYIYADSKDASSEVLNPKAIPDGMVSSLVSQMTKPLIDAYATGNFDAYCDKLVEAFTPYYSRMALDSNGEPANGSGNECKQVMPTANKKQNGGYDIRAYNFHYDWRLDPFYTAEQLNTYINKVKQLTGSAKVDLVGRCLGVNIVMAYLYAYGYDSLRHCVLYDGGLDGFETCGAVFSGDITVDGDCLERYVNSNVAGDEGGIIDIAKAVMSVTNSLFVLNPAIGEVMDIYEKVYSNVLPRLMRISHGSFPSFWSMVGDEYYEKAKQVNFTGKEEECKGLIEKADNYHYNVFKNTRKLLDDAQKAGVKLTVVAKYGFQMIPICKEAVQQSDQLISLSSNSYGAVSAGMGETLSRSYLEAAQNNGKAAYISPDNIVDASACYLPEHTWIIKNLTHNLMPGSVDRMLSEILAFDGHMTVNDNAAFPRYLVYTAANDSLAPMTNENCKTEEEGKMITDSSENLNFLIYKFKQMIDRIIQFITSLVQSFQGKIPLFSPDGKGTITIL